MQLLALESLKSLHCPVFLLFSVCNDTISEGMFHSLLVQEESGKAKCHLMGGIRPGTVNCMK